jgi:hypothetical protein
MPAVGDAIIATGYGTTEANEMVTTLRERETTVRTVGPAPATTGTADAVVPGSFTTGEALCRGDSGAPAFAPSGAVVGIAHTVSRPDLTEFTGTASDCISSSARSQFRALAAAAPWLESVFEETSATPWLEGEPNPRQNLAGFGDRCDDDAECRSHACVAGTSGTSVCSQGCRAAPCPEGYACTELADRLQCLPAPNTRPTDGAVVPPSTASADGGCSAVRGNPSGLSLGLVLALVLGWRHLQRTPRRRAR